MVWIVLLLAGTLEVVWAFGMKASLGFTRLWPSVITLAAMIGSVWLLGISMKTLPLGTAYAIWTGIGAVGAFVVGVLVLGEPASALRLVSVTLIIVGLVGLKLAS